jgi:hypothetical protein
MLESSMDRNDFKRLKSGDPDQLKNIKRDLRVSASGNQLSTIMNRINQNPIGMPSRSSSLANLSKIQ